jgi:hypothetical protein
MNQGLGSEVKQDSKFQVISSGKRIARASNTVTLAA